MAAAIIALLYASFAVAKATSPVSFCDVIPGWETLWIEEFDGTDLDLSAWTIDTQVGE